MQRMDVRLLILFKQQVEQHAQFSGQDESALREQFQVDAGKRVRVNLTLEAIANAENIEVSDEDVQKEYEKMAEMYQRDVQEIKAILTAQDQVSLIFFIIIV